MDWNATAFITSTGFIEQLAIEQLLEDPLGQHTNTKFFENIDEAREWVLNFSEGKPA